MTADATSADFVAHIESLGARAVIPCEAGAMVWRIWGEGPPLVLLHGASGSWTHWIRNVLPLAARSGGIPADGKRSARAIQVRGHPGVGQSVEGAAGDPGARHQHPGKPRRLHGTASRGLPAHPGAGTPGFRLPRDRRSGTLDPVRSRRSGQCHPDRHAALSGSAHSITWSARPSSADGMVSPRVFPVLRLITSSDLMDRSTGRSAGLAPLRILATS